MRWNITTGPGYALAYNIPQRLARLLPVSRQQAFAVGHAIFARIMTEVRKYIDARQKYVLYFRDVYRKVCAILHQSLEQYRNEDAILVAILIFKNSYRTNSFPEAVATYYTIMRNQGQPDANYGCGSDADVRYRITDQGCEVLEVSYGKPFTVESPCSKSTYKWPAMPFPQSKDRDDRSYQGGGGGGGDNRIKARVAVAIPRGGRKSPRTRSPRTRTPRTRTPRTRTPRTQSPRKRTPRTGQRH